MKDTDQIAAEAADGYLILVRQWLGYDIPIAWRKALIEDIKSAIEKATEETNELLDWAWTILANAGGGDWTKESKDWQGAVVKWRDEYHKNLSERRKTDPQCNLPRVAHASEEQWDRTPTRVWRLKLTKSKRKRLGIFSRDTWN